MNKLELINAIAARNTRLNGPALSKAQIDSVLDNMGAVARQHLTSPDADLVLPGIGKLVVKTRAPRTWRDPKSGSDIDLPAHNVVKFRVSQVLKDAAA